jgi:hypothetical protein
MLRSNLKNYRKFVVTLRGVGYKFEVWNLNLNIKN